MDESRDNIQNIPGPSSSSSSSSSIFGPSTSASASRVQEEVNEHEHNENTHQHNPQEAPLNQHEQQPTPGSYRVTVSISDVGASEIRDDVWSCVFLLVTFWVFAASMTLILGLYGSVTVQLGPHCSRLIHANPFFVQSIKVEELDEQKPGLQLYGFHKPPPLDVEISWTETHDAFVPADFHKEWIFFLNKGSKVDISYSVKSPGSLPLSLVITQGRESLVEWIEDPSYPNTTLSWNIIYGSGQIQQEISKSSNYYIALYNLNLEEVQVQLKFSIKGLMYETAQAHYRCSLSNRLCALKLHLLGTNAAVLSSPGPKEGTPISSWYVKVSYEPRWITYFVGSGVMTVLMLLACRFCNMFHITSSDGSEIHAGEIGFERAPLLARKDDDTASCGSSYESVSHDEEDLEEWLAVRSHKGVPQEGEINNPLRVCVVCCDAPRECFFLPCGHCATCFTCGTRIGEDAGICPICRRKIKKVRKIFTV